MKACKFGHTSLDLMCLGSCIPHQIIWFKKTSSSRFSATKRRYWNWIKSNESTYHIMMNSLSKLSGQCWRRKSNSWGIFLTNYHKDVCRTVLTSGTLLILYTPTLWNKPSTMLTLNATPQNLRKLNAKLSRWVTPGTTDFTRFHLFHVGILFISNFTCCFTFYRAKRQDSAFAEEELQTHYWTTQTTET